MLSWRQVTSRFWPYQLCLMLPWFAGCWGGPLEVPWCESWWNHGSYGPWTWRQSWMINIDTFGRYVNWIYIYIYILTWRIFGCYAWMESCCCNLFYYFSLQHTAWDHKIYFCQKINRTTASGLTAMGKTRITLLWSFVPPSDWQALYLLESAS